MTANSKRELLSRSQSSDFIRLEGLQKLTNVTAHDWDLYILKELVDNALDADEMVQHEIGSPSIRVIMEYDREAHGLRVTVSNRAQFPLEFVRDLFDLEKRVSVKDYYNHPTRGAQGNALKTILGIPYALHYRFLSDYNLDEVPLAITCGDRRVEIRLTVDELHQTVGVITEEKAEEDDIREETTVSVGIFRFVQKRPRTADELKKWAKAFAFFNPHASFSFTFVFLENTDAAKEETFETQGDPNWKTKYDLSQPAPVTWYTYSEFKELLYAVLAHSQEHTQPAPTLGEIAAMFGIADFPRTREFTEDTRLDALNDTGGLKTDATRRLFKLLKHQAQHFPPPALGEIDAHHFQSVIGAQPMDDGKTLFFYRRGEGDLTQPAAIDADKAVHPFVLEVTLSGNTDGKRQVIVGINHTPTYQDPFFNKPLVPYNAAIEDVQRSLEKLLDYYNLRDESAVTLIVHLIAPNVEYENYGKSAISDEPYREVLTQLIHEVVEEYREATRPPDPIDYLTSPAQQLIEQAIEMLTLGKRNFSENQLLFVLKRLLIRLDNADISADLSSQNADGRLRSVIRNRHSSAPIDFYYTRPSGRMAVPRHPRDSINVFFDNVSLLDLLYHYQSRAILITPREALEELLIALDFPVHYDCAILRADGNFKSALGLLLYRISLIASDAENSDHHTLPKLWLVHDLTLEGVQQRQDILQMIADRGLPPDILIDLGLDVEDVDQFDVLRDRMSDTPTVDRQVLLRAGILQKTLQFLLDDGFSVQLDSMTPMTLAEWFEAKLQAHDETLKAIPDTESLTGLVIEDLRSRFRRVVGDLSFAAYDLESVQVKVVDQWRSSLPNWAADLHERMQASLVADPRQSWQHVLDEALSSMLHAYLTAHNEGTIRRLISEQLSNASDKR